MGAAAVKNKGVPLARLRIAAAPAVTATRKDRRSIADAFPEVEPGLRPMGERILVQLRTPLSYTTLANGEKFYLPDETREAEMWNEQTAIVRFVGPVAYRDRKTLEYWQEGPWCKPGDFVRIQKYHVDKNMVSTGPKSEDVALFVTLKDTDVIALVTGDPMSIKAFL